MNSPTEGVKKYSDWQLSAPHGHLSHNDCLVHGYLSYSIYGYITLANDTLLTCVYLTKVSLKCILMDGIFPLATLHLKLTAGESTTCCPTTSINSLLPPAIGGRS